MFLSVLMIAAIVGCSSAAPKADRAAGYAVNERGYEAVEERFFGMTDYPATNTTSEFSHTPTQFPAQRKIVQNASLNIETTDYEAFMKSLKERILTYSGYIESETENGSQMHLKQNRYARLCVRVPAKQLEFFLNEIMVLGNTTKKNISSEYITTTYIDVESRLGVLRDEEQVLREFLVRAETTSDLLAVQSQLYDVIEEIESAEARLRSFDSLVSYSTVNLSIEEVVALSPAPEETRWQELTRRIQNSLTSLKETCIDLAIGFVVVLPWILTIGVVTLLIVLIVRAIVKRTRKRKK